MSATPTAGTAGAPTLRAFGAAVAALVALSCRPPPSRVDVPPLPLPPVASAVDAPPPSAASDVFDADVEIALVPIPVQEDSTLGAERLVLAGGAVLTPLARQDSYHPDSSGSSFASKSRRWCSHSAAPPRVTPAEVYPSLPPRDTLVWQWNEMECWEAIIVRSPALVTIADVTGASVFSATVDTHTTSRGRTTVTRTSEPLVSVEISAAASARLTQWNEAHPGERLAVVVRGLSVQEWRVEAAARSFTVSKLGPKATADDFRELARRLDPLTRGRPAAPSSALRPR